MNDDLQQALGAWDRRDEEDSRTRYARDVEKATALLEENELGHLAAFPKVPYADVPDFVRWGLVKLWTGAPPPKTPIEVPATKERALAVVLAILQRLDSADQHRVVDALVALGQP